MARFVRPVRPQITRLSLSFFICGERLMNNKAIHNYIISRHAKFELSRRSISEEVIHSVLRNPEQRYDLRSGRVMVQSRMIMENKTYLIRVFVDVNCHPAIVVTAYRTSKVEKYWRQKS